MERYKIIHICHRSYNAYFPPKESPYYYLGCWNSLVARYTVKYTNKYTIEVWRAEKEIKYPITCKVYGVLCRLFPGRYFRYVGVYSNMMFKELKHEVVKNKILIHLNGIHHIQNYLVAEQFRYVPIVAQHHGGMPALIKLKQNKKVTTLLLYLIETAAIKHIDHFFVLRKEEARFLAKVVPESNITLQTMGVDFDKFKPINKSLAKRRLGIPQNKKVILYVGKLYKLKGVDIILEIYRKLKKKYNLELLFVGCSPEDPLYKEAIASGAHIYGHVAHHNMPLYYNAADVYLLPAFDKNYMGIDVATLEALACNVPVVSTILYDFPTDEWKKLGRIPKNERDVMECVIEVLENLKFFKNCREVAQKYYDWSIIIPKTIEIYDRLFNKY